MPFHPSERVFIAVDGANTYSATQSLGIEIDFRRLLDDFRSKAFVMRAYYYTAVLEGPGSSSLRPLIDWLDYNGFTVVTKSAKEQTDNEGRRRIKGNMDVELVVDALELAPFRTVLGRRRLHAARRRTAAARQESNGSVDAQAYADAC